MDVKPPNWGLDLFRGTMQARWRKGERGMIFLDLFRGSSRAHGETLIDGTPKGSPRTVDGPITEEVVTRHIAGEIRMGAVPVDENGMAWFGAVDVDKHDGSGVDLIGLAALVEKKGWPGIVCRTRRGGAHVYFFMAQPTDARLLIKFLETVAKGLKGWGEPIEVFPKQGILTDGNKGNWIHLPYCGGDEGSTYAVTRERDGSTFGPITMAEFFELALARRMQEADLQHNLGLPPSGDIDLTKGPPCIERMFQEGVEEGGRSNALVNFAVYLQKAGLDIKAELAKFNATVFAKPLPRSVLRDVASRVERNSYGYLCTSAPMCEMCDKAECERREFGVSAKAFSFDVEIFRGIEKIDFEKEPSYMLRIRNRVVELKGNDVMNWKVVKRAVLDATNEILPNLKDHQWESILRNLMEGVKVIPAPTGSSPDAVVRELIERFVSPVQEKARTDFRHAHADVLCNMPVILEDHFGLRVAFRPTDLLAQAKRRKVELAPDEAWMVANRMGYEHDIVAIGGKNHEIWWKGIEVTPAPAFTSGVGDAEY